MNLVVLFKIKGLDFWFVGPRSGKHGYGEITTLPNNGTKIGASMHEGCQIASGLHENEEGNSPIVANCGFRVVLCCPLVPKRKKDAVIFEGSAPFVKGPTRSWVVSIPGQSNLTLLVAKPLHLHHVEFQVHATHT